MAEHWAQRMIGRYGAVAVHNDLLAACRDGVFATERVEEAKRFIARSKRPGDPMRIFDIECEDQDGNVEIVRVATDVTITTVLTILPPNWPWETKSDYKTRAREKRKQFFKNVEDEDPSQFQIK